jgi:hypothetical protein
MNPIVIEIITLVLLAFAILWKLIDWQALAIKWVGNDPDRAQIYIKAGDTVRTIRGERIYNGAEGDIYIYKPEKFNQIIILPRARTPYPYYFIRGRRIIGIEDGHIIASPLGFMPENMRDIYKEGVSDVSAIQDGNTMVRAIHSLKSLKVGNMLLIGLAFVLVVGGIFYYLNRNKNAGVVPTANVTTTQQVAPLPIPSSNQTTENITITIPTEQQPHKPINQPGQ